MDETYIKYETVKKLTQQESDELYLAMQWPEDLAKAKKLLAPTNITELNFKD